MKNSIIEINEKSPAYMDLLAESFRLRIMEGKKKLKALVEANIEKRTDNTALFDAVDFRDELRAHEKQFEDLRKTALNPINIQKTTIQGMFKSRKGETKREPEELENFRRLLDKQILAYQKREMPDEKTIQATHGRVTVRVDHVLEVKDKEAFVKACVSKAKSNEAFTLDFLEINETKLKAFLKENPDVKIPKNCVEFVYKETIV